MSAGQESGSPIRENRTLLPEPLPPDEAQGTLAAAAAVSTVGLRPPFDSPAAAFSSRLSRRSHLDCRAAGLRTSQNLGILGSSKREVIRCKPRQPAVPASAAPTRSTKLRRHTDYPVRRSTSSCPPERSARSKSAVGG